MELSAIDNKKQMSNSEIIKKYKQGERNFSGIRCVGRWFDGQDLTEIDLSGSDLSFSNFSNSTLIGSNFTGCNLTWSDLSRANLKGTIFKNSNLSWSAIIESIVDTKTDFSGADLSYIVAFNTNINSAKIDGIKMVSAVLRITDIGSNPNFALKQLERADIPDSLKQMIRKQVIEINELANRIKGLLPRSYKDEVRTMPARVDSETTEIGSTYAGKSAYDEMSAYVSRDAYKRKTSYG